MIQHRSIAYRNTVHRQKAETGTFDETGMFGIKTLHHKGNRKNCVISYIMQFFVSYSAISERKGVIICLRLQRLHR